MSLYCYVDDHDLGQVATIQGWSDFIEWANQQGYYEMAHLSQHGYSTNLSMLAAELGQALEESKPKEDVESTARGLEEIANSYPKAEILIISDGDGSGGDDDDDEDDESQPPKKSKKKTAKKTSDNKIVANRKPPAKKASTGKSPKKR
jgi:hypothetical protein